MKALNFKYIFLFLITTSVACASEELYKEARNYSFTSGEAYDVVEKKGEKTDTNPVKSDPKLPGDNNPQNPSDGGQPPLSSHIPVDWPQSFTDFVETVSDPSLITSFAYPDLHEGDSNTCCRDFGDSSKRPGIDNAFALLNQQLGYLHSPGTIDANQALATYTEKSDTRLLIDSRAFQPATLDSPERWVTSLVEVKRLDSYSPNAFQGHEYGYWYHLIPTLFPKRLTESTPSHFGTPIVVSNPTTYHNEVALSTFTATVTLPVAIGDLVLPLPVEDLHIQGDVILYKAQGYDPTPIYRNAQLSGYVVIPAIFNQLNQYVTEHCACENQTADIFSQDRTGTWSGSCNASTFLSCQASLSPICKKLVFSSKVDPNGQCHTLPALIQNVADIDVDLPQNGQPSGKQTWDALSIGYFSNTLPLSNEIIDN